MNALTAEWVSKAVNYRYPGEAANKMEAQMAYEVVTSVRTALRTKLKAKD
jgi:hypothetical protein